MEYIISRATLLPNVHQISDSTLVGMSMEEAVLPVNHNEHLIFITPIDDDNTMVITVDYHVGEDAELDRKLKEKRAPEIAKHIVENDPRPWTPYRGSIRAEDVMTQDTQPKLGERQERLGYSDRGVILLRKMVRDAIQAVEAGHQPKGILKADQEGRVLKLDTYVAVKPKGTMPQMYLDDAKGV